MKKRLGYVPEGEQPDEVYVTGGVGRDGSVLCFRTTSMTQLSKEKKYS